MKKNKIILGIGIITLTVIISSVFNWNTSKGNQTEATNDKLIASNLEVSQNRSEKSDSRFFCTINTRYNAVKKKRLRKSNIYQRFFKSGADATSRLLPFC